MWKAHSAALGRAVALPAGCEAGMRTERTDWSEHGAFGGQGGMCGGCVCVCLCRELRVLPLQQVWKLQYVERPAAVSPAELQWLVRESMPPCTHTSQNESLGMKATHQE